MTYVGERHIDVLNLSWDGLIGLVEPAIDSGCEETCNQLTALGRARGRSCVGDLAFYDGNGSGIKRE